MNQTALQILRAFAEEIRNDCRTPNCRCSGSKARAALEAAAKAQGEERANDEDLVSKVANIIRRDFNGKTACETDYWASAQKILRAIDAYQRDPK